MDLLEETYELGTKSASIPIEQSHRLEKEESSAVGKWSYEKLVGKLIISHTRSQI